MLCAYCEPCSKFSANGSLELPDCDLQSLSIGSRNSPFSASCTSGTFFPATRSHILCVLDKVIGSYSQRKIKPLHRYRYLFGEVGGCAAPLDWIGSRSSTRRRQRRRPARTNSTLALQHRVSANERLENQPFTSPPRGSARASNYWSLTALSGRPPTHAHNAHARARLISHETDWVPALLVPARCTGPRLRSCTHLTGHKPGTGTGTGHKRSPKQEKEGHTPHSNTRQSPTPTRCPAFPHSSTAFLIACREPWQRGRLEKLVDCARAEAEAEAEAEKRKREQKEKAIAERESVSRKQKAESNSGSGSDSGSGSGSERSRRHSSLSCIPPTADADADARTPTVPRSKDTYQASEPEEEQAPSSRGKKK